MHSKKAMRQNAAVKKPAQLPFDEPRDKAFALSLPGQESLELFSNYSIKNTVGRVARDVIRGGFAEGKLTIQPHAAVIIAILQLIFRKIYSTLAYHHRCGLHRLWKAAVDLIAAFQVEPNF